MSEAVVRVTFVPARTRLLAAGRCETIRMPTFEASRTFVSAAQSLCVRRVAKPSSRYAPLTVGTTT
jgi:hypothetical protein